MRIVTPGIVPVPEAQQDSRSDAELIEYLKAPPPVTHERNIWAFWDSGFDNMRPWTKRNVLNWIRLQGSTWDVRVLDMVPGSATNVHNFVPTEQLPECFNNQTMDGFTKGPHASDMVRLPLIYLHGGAWIDAGCILFRNLDDIAWRDLEDPKSPYEMFITLFQSRKYIGQCLTGFFMARKGNPFIYRWMRVWQEVWKGGRTNCQGLHKHPLLEPLGFIIPPDFQEQENPRQIDMGGKAAEFDIGILTDYLALNMAYERVRCTQSAEDEWDGPKYYREHVHLVDTIDEVWKSHEMLLQDELFPLLSLPFKPEEVESDPKQKAASDYVGHVLANCSMAKFSQGHWQPGLRIPLAMSWSQPENADADIKEGTWAEYFRWASTSCQQTRLQGKTLESIVLGPERNEILTGRLLQA